MKRLCLSLVLIFSLLLTACSSKNMEQEHEKLSQRLCSRESLSFVANVRAEYEHKTARFTLSYTEDENGATVTVLAPELISGISARVEPGSTSLQYDGVMLGTGELDDLGLSPMSALPLLMDALKNGALDSVWEEDGKTVMQLIPSDTLSCTVWFNPDELVPVRAELISGGRVCVYAEISQWNES